MMKRQHGFAAFVICIWGAISTQAQVAQTNQTSDDILLEQRVSSEFSEIQLAQPAKTFSGTQALMQLKAFAKAADSQTTKCVDAKKMPFGHKYVLSLDAAGKPCRIYDLSFPNIKSLFAKRSSLQIPVQNLTSADYLNWLDGRFDQVQSSTDQYQRNFNPRIAAQNSWISKLKFRNTPVAIPGSKNSSRDIGLPKTFHASDLDLGSQFQFDMKTRAEMQRLISDIRSLPSMSGNDSVASESMIKVLNKPELMMESVRFDWNELKKAYDIILEGDFLPLSGPVALIDYKVQYKYAVEKAFRSILSEGLYQMSRYIPAPMVSNAVAILVQDSFEQIEMMYDYQMAQLEDTLKTGLIKSTNDIGIDAANSQKAIELLFGQKSDLISSYILSVAQGKAFDWENFAKLGKSARYTTEKNRDISLAKMNSLMVLEKNCQMQIVHNYFGACTKAGKKDALYSLISERTVMSKSFGPPMIYRYDRPYEMSLRRGGTWLLSIGLRLFGLNISRTVVYQLDGILKNYINTGILDEAMLRNSMAYQLKSGMILSNENSNIMKWLYIQNLNPFLPKSMESETTIIAKNKQLLDEAKPANAMLQNRTQQTGGLN